MSGAETVEAWNRERIRAVIEDLTEKQEQKPGECLDQALVRRRILDEHQKELKRLDLQSSQ